MLAPTASEANVRSHAGKAGSETFTGLSAVSPVLRTVNVNVAVPPVVT